MTGADGKEGRAARIDRLRADLGAGGARNRIAALLELAELLAGAQQGPTSPDAMREAIALLSEARALWNESRDPAGLLARIIAALGRLLGPFVGDRGATGRASTEFDAGVGLLAEAVDGAPFEVESSDRLVLGRLLLWRFEVSGSLEDVRRADDAEASTRPRRTRGPRAHGRTVSTGFTDLDNPHGSSDPHRCLHVDSSYLFWFGMSDAPLPGAIDRRPAVLPADVPTGTTLTVALFGFPGEIEVPAGQDVGEITLYRTGWEVTGQPGPASGDRLLFPVHTPARPGKHRLRCNVYRSQTLLQSHLVTVEVEAGAPARRNALRSTADYTANTALDAAELDAVAPLTLSVLVNDNGDGHHGFRFLGREGSEIVKADSVAGPELGDLTERARRALRKVTWGRPQEWQPGDTYQYGEGAQPDLAADLSTLASAGWMIWSHLSSRMTHSWSPGAEGGDNARLRLTALLRNPGTLEFATKDGAGVNVPAGIVYDYLLDTQALHTVCTSAVDAISRHANLAAEPCFQGRCPSHLPGAEQDTVVCPGGFWGFRHQIGFPQTVQAATAGPVGGQLLSSLRPISFSGRPRCVVGAATDFDQGHPQAVARLGDPASATVIVERAALLAAWRNTAAPPHLVYLFCHGSVSEYGLPALRVGGPDADLVTPDNIDYRIDWRASRPLVILNGCRTAAGEPRYPLRFVDAFIRDAAASGVIGTEVTTFPSLAIAFADLLLGALFEPGVTVAEALRRARLGLLATGNPLGLIYVGYAAPQLRLDATISPPAAAEPPA